MLMENLINAMEQLEEEKVMSAVRGLIDEGCDNYVIEMLLNAGIKKVGEHFEEGEYFIADLIVSGLIYRSALVLLKANSKIHVGQPMGKIVIGVAKDDFHDIGKDIVVDMLMAEGFEVLDLGVDVRAEQFVSAVRKHKPDILLLSGLMEFAQKSMANTVAEIRRAGLREGLAILVGGHCVDNGFHLRIGADMSAVDPLDTVEFCKKVTAGKKL